MKRKTAAALITALALAATASVAAAPSISQIIPENPRVVEGNLKDGQQLVVKNADTAAYQDKKVAEAVEWANDDNTVPTVKEILTRLDVDTKQEFRTESGHKVNPTLYEQLTPFVDLVIQEGNQVSYTSDGQIKATVTVDAAKGMDRRDLLVMQIDPNSGKVYFVTVERFNREKGEITATFPTLGPISLLKTVPIVVKDVSPEKYASRKTAEVVTEFIEKKKDIEFEDVLHSMDILDKLDPQKPTELKLTDLVTVSIQDYSSAMGFADLAIKQGQDSYLYDMDGTLEAEARRDIHDTDWERLVLAGNPDFDTEAAREDLSMLTELDPFVVEDSFVMQIDPVTGEAEYIYEPELYFAYAEDGDADAGAEDTEDTQEAETGEDTADVEDTASGEEDVLQGWEIHDEDREDEEAPDLVIRAEYRSMGPFAIFMPKDGR